MVLVGEPNLNINFNLQRWRWIELNRIALSFDCVHNNRVSVSRMLKQITDGKLSIVWTERLIETDGIHAITAAPVDPHALGYDDRDIEGFRHRVQGDLPAPPMEEPVPRSDDEFDPDEYLDDQPVELP